MAGKLTPKQEAFARIYVETSNASEAYRQAYDVKETTLSKTVNEAASRVLSNSKVAAMVMGLQDEARERTMVTVESLTRELDEDRELAREVAAPSAAISAVLGKAKLHGLLVDKTDNKNTHAFSPELAAWLGN
jgi:phage terminase small subunit